MITHSVIFAAALVGSPYRPVPVDDAPAISVTRPGRTDCTAKGSKMTAACPAGKGIANLPYAFGKRFATLDAYLDHLEKYAGPIDLPWWKETAPGTYRLVTSGPTARTEVATRQQLLKRFGFKR